MIGRHGFRQREIKQDRISESQATREQKRHVVSPTAQDAANRGPKYKTQAERRADQSHSFGAIFFGGDIGDVGLRGRDVAAGNSINDAAEKKHPQRGGKSQNQESGAGAENADQQNWPPPIFIRESTQHRREYELHHGIRCK